MRSTYLLIVGIIFLVMAFIGVGILGRPQEIARHQYSKDISMVTIKLPTTTPSPLPCPTPPSTSTSTLQMGSNPTPLYTRTTTPIFQITPISSRTPTSTRKPTSTKTPISSTIPTSTKTPIPATVTPFIIPNIFLQVEWPYRLQADLSDSVWVKLIKSGGNNYVVTVETPGHTAVVSSPIPINTPVYESSGEIEYKPFAIASLAGANFIIQSPTPVEQWLGQSNLDWIWNISSNKPGNQVIKLAPARRVDNLEVVERYQVWNYPLDVEIYRPLFSAGQISIMSLVSGCIGSGLSIPWLKDQIKKKKAKSKKKRG
jgi:hypothetical protein